MTLISAVGRKLWHWKFHYLSLVLLFLFLVLSSLSLFLSEPAPTAATGLGVRTNVYFLLCSAADLLWYAKCLSTWHSSPAALLQSDEFHGHCNHIHEHAIDTNLCAKHMYKTKLNYTPWPESVSEIYQLIDCCLSAKLVATFADRGCHMVSVTNPHSRNLSFLTRAATLASK
jgi:hypothetical protein